MLSEKYLALVILAAVASTVLAKPSGLPLSIVKDKTICKTVVDYDEDEHRIPRVIKVLKCADDQENNMCASGADAARCCSGGPLRCVEVLDSVLVSHVKKGTYTMNVPIGCSCIKSSSSGAADA